MKPDRLDRTTFDALVNTNGEHLVSISLPTHEKGREVSQDSIRLKNELAEIDQQLETLGVKPRQRADKLASAHELIDDVEFWEHQGQQLALYIDAHDQTKTFATSDVVERVPSMVCSHFQVRYLLPDLDAPSATALVLNKNFVGLYSVDRTGAKRLDVDLPESFEDVNWFTDRERQRQQHPDRAGSTGNRHGHDPASSEGEDIARFVRAVDDGIAMDREEDVLVVLGDDRLVGEFSKQHSGEVIGKPDSGVFTDDPVAIRDAIAPVLEDRSDERSSGAMSDAREGLGRGDAVVEIAEALNQTRSGRIGTLVIHRDAAPLWGVWNSDEGTTRIQDRHHDAGDLLNQLVIQTVQTGGGVAVVPQPIDEHEFVALQRF